MDGGGAGQCTRADSQRLLRVGHVDVRHISLRDGAVGNLSHLIAAKCGRDVDGQVLTGSTGGHVQVVNAQRLGRLVQDGHVHGHAGHVRSTLGILGLDGEDGASDGEGGGLRAAVVAHARHDDGSRSGVHVVQVGYGVVHVLGQDDVAVLHGDSRLFRCAVIFYRGVLQFYGELSLRTGGNDGELGLHLTGEVAVLVGGHGHGVRADVRSLVAAHGVVGGGHVKVPGLHAAHGHALFRAVVGQRGLGQRHLRQRSLVDGHAHDGGL